MMNDPFIKSTDRKNRSHSLNTESRHNWNNSAVQSSLTSILHPLNHLHLGNQQPAIIIIVPPVATNAVYPFNATCPLPPSPQRQYGPATMLPTQAHQSKAQYSHRRGPKKYCNFCYSETHDLIDSRGVKSCPALLQHQCEKCGEYGHTRSYCGKVGVSKKDVENKNFGVKKIDTIDLFRFKNC